MTLAMLVVSGFAMEVHGRNETVPSPTPRAGVAVTRRPPPSTSLAAGASDDVDARALVAALLLEGARHGWHAR